MSPKTLNSLILPALLGGIGGTDILEGIYKSFKVEKVYIKRK